MANLAEIRTRGRVTDAQQVMEYVRQLEEQIRYTLNHLDGGNIASGAIGAEQLSSAVISQMKKDKESAARSTARVINGNARLDEYGYRQGDGKFQVRGNGESFLSLGGTEGSPALRISGSGRIEAQRVNVKYGRTPGMVVTLQDPTPQEGEQTPEKRFQIVVGASRPEGHGVLWLKTGTEGENGIPCEVYYIA